MTTLGSGARRRARVRLLAATALSLGIGIGLAAPALSESVDIDPSDGCTAAERSALKAQGDNFADACLAGNDFAGLAARKPGKGGPKGDPDRVLAPGETASSRMSLIANVPKQGAFAGEGSYNSDLAFKGKYVFAGNYDGFTVYDISRPSSPRTVTQVVCPGSQNDISVYQDVLVLSVDSSRSDDSCSSTAQSATIKGSWEGLRVFDISNPANPEYVASVETACGSHTHTLAPEKKGRDLFVYVSSYSPNAAFPDCAPPHDLISVVKVPLRDPSAAELVGTPVLFPDGGQPAGGYSRETSGCHDITAYPSKDLAAGACMGDGILMDISDRENPKVIERVRDTQNFAFWHSATFNNRGTKVVFTDELGGGGAPTCNPETGSTKGANAIYTIDRRKQLQFGSYYKIGRTQANTENCVAHNGSLIPVKGNRDIMVQAWYQGGISVFDFTNPRKPRELAWFDRGALSAERLVLGGSWSAYYYNGHVYSNDIQKGLDVLRIDDRSVKSAEKVRMDVFNPQSQPFYN